MRTRTRALPPIAQRARWKRRQHPRILGNSVAALLALVLSSATPARATVLTWTGVNDNFWETNAGTSPTNWSPSTITPFTDINDADLHFGAGPTVLNPFNNSTAGQTVLQSITFDSGGASYTLGGSAVVMDGGGSIVNNSTNLQTVSFTNTAGFGGIQLNQFNFNTSTNNPVINWTAASGDILITNDVSFSSPVTLTFNGSHNVTISGSLFEVSGGVGSLVVSGSGTVVLSGASNNLSGTTTISNGKIQLGADNAISATGLLTVDGTNGSAGQLDLNGHNQAISALTLNAPNNGGTAISGAGTLSLNGDLNLVNNTSAPGQGEGSTLIAAGTLALSAGNHNFNVAGQITNQQDLIISSAITGAGGLTINAMNSSVNGTPAGVVFTGNDTYTGATNVMVGTLQVGNGTSGNLTGTSGVTMAAGTTLVTDLAAGSTFTANISLNGSNTVLNTMQSGTNTFSGSISGPGVVNQNGSGPITFSGNLSGLSAFNQNGTGTTLLSGNNNYSGTTTISNGKIQLGADNAISTTGLLTVDGTNGSAGQLDLNGHNQAISALTLNAPNNGGTAISGAGTLSLNGDLNLVNNTSAPGQGEGSTLIAAGTLALSAGNHNFNVAGQITNQQDLIISSAITGAGGLTINAMNSSVNGTPAGVVFTGNDTYTGATNVMVGTLQVGNGTSGNLTGTSGVTMAAGTTLVTDLAAGSTFTANISLNGSNTVLNTMQSGTNTFSGSISGPGVVNQNGSGPITFSGNLSGLSAFNQNGTGTTLLSGNNNYSGTTTISNGKIQLGADNAISATGLLTVDGTNGSAGQLDLNGHNQAISALTLNAPNNGGTAISGAGTLSLNGDLNLVNNTSAPGQGEGSTLIAAGTLALSAGNHNFNVAGQITNQQDLIISSAITGAGGLTINAMNSSVNGTPAGVVFTGNDTYTGATNVMVGTLQVGNGTSGNLTGTSGVTMAAGTTLVTDLAAGSTFTANISLNGSNTVLNTMQSGTNTFSGSISGPGVVNQNGSGPITFSGNLSGLSAFNQNGTGTTLLSGNNNYSGTTTISNGKIQLGADNAISATGLLTVDGTNGSAGQLDLNGHNQAISALTLNAPNNGGTAISGAGTLSLNGDLNLVNNTSAPGQGEGSTLIAAGTLALSAGNHNFNVAGQITNQQDLIISSAITGAGGLTINAMNSSVNGTPAGVVFTGNDTYTGATNVMVGTLQVGNGTSGNLTGTSGVTMAAGTTLVTDLAAGSTFTANISLNGSNTVLNTMQSGTNTFSGSISGPGVVNQNGSGPITFSGNLSGLSAFNQNGTGTTLLSGNNNYSGTTTISNGKIQLGADNAISTTGLLTVDGTNGSAGQLDLNGHNQAISALTLNAPNNGGTAISGAGTLSLNGDLNLVNNTSAPGQGEGSTLIAAGTLALSAGNHNFNVAGQITNQQDLIISSAITGAGGLTINATNSSVNGTPAGVVFTGSNTYTGSTSIINGGTLSANVVGALPAPSADGGTGTVRSDVIMDQTGSGGSTLSLGARQAISSLTGAAGSKVTLGANRLTIGNSGSGQTEFDGVISGTGGLTMDGTNTQVLGGANTYTGATNLNNGLLFLVSTGSLAAGSTVNVNSGGFLAGVGTAAGTVIVNSGGEISAGGVSNTPGTLTVGNLMLNSGATSKFRLAQAGVTGMGINDLVNVTGNLTLGGTLLVVPQAGFGVGSYTLYTYTGSENGSFNTINGLTGLNGTIVTGVAGQVSLTVSPLSTTQYWDGSGSPNDGIISGGSGTWDNSTSNWTDSAGATNSTWQGNTAVFAAPGGTVTLGAAISAQALIFGSTGYVINGSGSNTLTLTGSTPTINVTNATDTATIAAQINGSNGLNVTGAGTLILTNSNNNYTGNTAISGATLQIGTVGTTGSLGGGASSSISISNGGTFAIVNPVNTTLGGNFSNGVGGLGTLLINSANSLILSGILSDGAAGQLALTQSGSGSTALTGANTYTGTTTISAGFLQVGNTATAGTLGSGMVIDNALLSFARSDTITVANTISGTGEVDQNGFGTLILSGANTYNGPTFVNAGTLQAGSIQAFGVNSAVTVIDGATLDLSGFSNTIGSLSDGGIFGSTALVTNTAGGGATLTINTPGAAATTSYGGLITNAAGSPLNLVISGAGTQSISNQANTYTGTTTVNAGATLDIDSSNGAGGFGSATTPLGTGALIINAGANIGTGMNAAGFAASTIANAVVVNGSFNVTNVVLPVGILGAPNTGIGAGTALVNTGYVPFGSTGVASNGIEFTGLTTLTSAGVTTINTASGYLDLRGAITGGGGLSFTGHTFTYMGNALYGGVVDAPNTYGGVTTVGDGTSSSYLELGKNAVNAYAIPGSIVISPNAYVQYDSGDGAVSNQIAPTANAVVNGTLDTAGLSQTVNDLSGAGTVRLDSAAYNSSYGGGVLAGTLTVGSGTFSGSIIGAAGNVTKTGSGTLLLSGSNSYTGTTIINGGTFQVDGSLAAASTVSVNSGGTLAGSGTVAGTVNVLSGGTLNPGPVGGTTPGTLTVGTLVLNSGANSNFRLAQAGVTGLGINDLVHATGNLTLAGNLNITQLSGFGVGSYTLYTYGGSLTNNGFSAINGLAGFTETLVTGVAGQVSLTVSAAGAITQYWDGNGAPNDSVISGGSGTWDNATVNWTNASGAANATWQGGTAVFAAPGGVVTLGAPISAQALTFGATGYTVASAANALTLTGATPTISVTNAGDTATISAALAGSNGLTTSGAGTLILTGANTYSGGTTISSGTLQIGNGGTAGVLGGGNVVANGTLAFARSDSPVMANVISGTGGLSQLGTGTTILTGANTYAGTTTISAGTLQVGNGGTTGTLGAGSVINNGALSFNHSDTLSVANSISGSGAVKQSGTGTTVLTGANTYAGTTTISAGTLQVGNGGTTGSLGTGSVINNGTLAFNRSDTLSVANSISGNGAVNQNGSGTTIVTATNTYTGATNVNAGTLQVGNGTSGNLTGTSGVTVTNNATLATNLADGATFAANVNLNGLNAALNLMQSGTNTIAGLISGTGVVNQNGTGTTILSGMNTYSGATTVSNGILEVNGSIANSITTVTSLGTLQGVGIVGHVMNNGTVAPGSTSGGPGTLTVNGNYSQGSSGNLRIGLSTSTFGKLAVNGSASLNGSVTAYSVGSFTPVVGNSFQVLSASSVSGTFSNVVDQTHNAGTLVQLQAAYGATGVTLKYVQGTIISGGGGGGGGGNGGGGNGGGGSGGLPASDFSGNGGIVGRIIDGDLNDPKLAPVLKFLDKLPLSALPAAIDRISPEELSALTTASTSLSNTQIQNIQTRLEALVSGISGATAQGMHLAGDGPDYAGRFTGSGLEGPNGAEGKESKEAPPYNPRLGTFITGAGEWVTVGNTDNARGYDLVTGGVTLGVDYKLTDNLAIGLDAGYAHTGINLENGGHSAIDAGNIGLYGTYFSGGFYADGAVGGTYSGYDNRRAGLQGDARGQTHGGALDVLFATGYNWHFGGLSLGPTGSFRYNYTEVRDYSEHGSLAPMSFPTQGEDSIRSSFGGKATYDWHAGGVIIRPEVSLAWQHEYGRTNPGVIAEFASGAGSQFTVFGPDTGRDSLLVGAGFAVIWSDRLSSYVYYDGEVARTNYDMNSITGGLRMTF